MNNDKLPTKERLARAIIKRSKGHYNPIVQRMVKLAREGHYDEFESDLAMPLHELVAALRRVGFNDLAERVIAGEFDASKEEGEAWMNKEGWSLLTGKKNSQEINPDV